MAQLSKAGVGEIKSGLRHPELGSIDVPWGEPAKLDENGRRITDGFGLAKVMQLHPEVIGDLPDRLASTSVSRRSTNRIRLASPHLVAIVRLEFDGEPKTWLLTAFDPQERQ